MRSRTVLQTLAAAFIAGGTGPSDVDNDGTVGPTDFLQLQSAGRHCQFGEDAILWRFDEGIVRRWAPAQTAPPL